MRGVAGVVGLALLAGGASAQPFIEIEFDVVRDQFGSISASGFRVVFDAGAAPVQVSATEVVFRSVFGESYFHNASGDDPFRPGATPFFSSELTYNEPGNYWDVGPNDFLRLRGPVPGAFTLAMTSLPDDPADYALVGPDAMISSPSGLTTAEWTAADGFEDGTIFYSVRVVDDPNVCAADMDGNGILNVDDIDAFVAGFLGGCP